MDSNFQFLVAKGCVPFSADDGPAIPCRGSRRTPATGGGELTLHLPLRPEGKSYLDRSFNTAITISAALTQHRQDLIPPGQCFCQPAELLIDLLLSRRIDASVGGQIADTAGQLLGVGYQENIAFAEPLQKSGRRRT